MLTTFDDWNDEWPLWRRLTLATALNVVALCAISFAIAGPERWGHVTGGMGLILAVRGLFGCISDWIVYHPCLRQIGYERPKAVTAGRQFEARHGAQRSCDDTRWPGNG